MIDEGMIGMMHHGMRRRTEKGRGGSCIFGLIVDDGSRSETIDHLPKYQMIWNNNNNQNRRKIKYKIITLVN
jgi:hypothetical protein